MTGFSISSAITLLAGLDDLELNALFVRGVMQRGVFTKSAVIL